MEKPRWLRDFLRFLPLKSQFVLSGNVQDHQAHEIQPGTVAPISLQAVLAFEFYARGYQSVFSFDLIRGIRLLSGTGEPKDATPRLTELGLPQQDYSELSSLERLGIILEWVASFEAAPLALIVDFASRLITRNGSLQPSEHVFFSRSQVASLAARAKPHGAGRKPYFNTITWIVDKEGDLPDWLLLGNPKIRHIPVPKPDHLARRSLARILLKSLPGSAQSSDEEFGVFTTSFVDETEGLLLMDLTSISELGRSEGLSARQISDAVRRYKVGVTEDAWQKIDRDKIRNAAGFVCSRVKGQEHAVTHALDIIKRAITGVGALRRGGRPRGVAFFAGPTGVGKTELAKTITTLLFGDESAYIRFDMSEFSAEHSDQRLIGAPPGYVGYDVGGELTNAIREKPFSVVLFDEIEKAHPRVLDKFLQILDDGVLTSGRGDRVYFSESLLIFTSNLGIYSSGQDGLRTLNVSPEEDFDLVKHKVRNEIDRHFKIVLNRPEILNRIGENIIVFDFIRPSVAVEILQQMIQQTLDDLLKVGLTVIFSDQARETLSELCLSDLSNGGRGIRNQVEACLINPLARKLFDVDAQPGSTWTILDIHKANSVSLSMEPSDLRAQ